MKTGLHLTLLATLLAPCVQAQTSPFIEDPRIADLRFGIVCAGWDYSLETAPDNVEGQVFRHDAFPEFDAGGRIVPAIDAISFTTIAQAAEGVSLAATTIIVTHPPHPETGATQQSFSGEPMAHHHPFLAGYRLSGETALNMLGVWTLSVEDADARLLYSIAFEVVQPEAAPFVAASCS